MRAANRPPLAPALFHVALRAFPRDFRARFGEQLERDFGDRLRELRAARTVARVRFVTKALADVLVSGLGERLERRRHGHLASAVAQGVDRALRGFRRAPGFALAVVATLALGIGANTTMFGIAERLLLRPPAYVSDADRVVQVHFQRLSPFTGTRVISPAFSYPDLTDMSGVGAFVSVAGFANTRATMGSGDDAERVRVQMADGHLFDLLGVRPRVGRFFGPEEDRVTGGSRVAVLGHGFWKRRFGADPAVIGRELRVGRERYTVVGVAPAGFTGPTIGPVDLWLPLRTMQSAEMGDGWTTARRWYWFSAVARLRPGMTVAAAEAAATAAHRAGRVAEVAAGRYDENARAVLGSLIPGRGPNPGSEIVVSRWLVGVSVVMLLIACANVANLLLLRAVRRRRESAVRIALGVSRGHLFVQLLVESLVLALTAGLVALAASRWGSMLVYRTLLTDLDPGDALRSPRVYLFATAAAITSALAAGLVPSLQAARPDVARDLRDGERSSPATGRLRSALLLAQVALSVVLLTGAGLFLRSLSAVHRLDLGFEPEGVLVARLESDDGSFTDETSVAVTLAMERLRGAPGVASVAVASLAPLEGLWGLTLLRRAGDTVQAPRGPYYYVASPDYFRTMGMNVSRGRGFTPADVGPSAPRVTILTEDLAARAFGSEDPLGQCLLVEGSGEDTCTRVVGVLENHSAAELVDDESPIFYLPPGHPAAQAPQTLLVRASSDPIALIEPVRRTLLASVPGARFASVTPLTDLIASRSGSWRLGATMFTLFGALALAVASLGLYAVVGFDVAQRRAELGVRAALGAPRGRLLWSALRHTLWWTSAGVAVGLGASVTLARAGRDLLFRVDPADPLAVGAAGLGLLLVAAIAALRPGVAAARTSPTEILRAE